MRLGVNDGTSRPPPLLIKYLYRADQIPSHHHFGFQSPPDVQSQRTPAFNSLKKITRVVSTP